jgi:hypothetical protein
MSKALYHNSNIVAQLFSPAQSVRILSTHGMVQLSGMVFAFSSRKSHTQRGSTVLSTFGIMIKGEAYGDDEGNRRT